MQSGSELFKKIIIDGNEVNISEIDAANGIYTLPSGKTRIRVQYVYQDNVTTIPSGVFSGISSLKKVRFPSNIVSIADDAFTGSGVDSESIATIKAINVKGFKYPVTLSVQSSNITIQKDGYIDLPSITATANNNTVSGLTYTYESSDTSKVTISNGRLNGIAAGSATITVTFAGSNDYSPATLQYSVNVSMTEKPELSNVTVSVSNYTYGGTKPTPTVSGNIENGTVTYSYAQDGSDLYSESLPDNYGNYKVKAVIAETTNYRQTTVYGTFKVLSAAGNIDISGKELSYTGSSLQLITIRGASGTVHYKVDDGSWSTTQPTATQAKTYTIYYYVDPSPSSEMPNYGPVASQEEPLYVQTTIAVSQKPAGSVSTPPTSNNPIYNSGGYLCTEGNGTGTIMYKVGNGEWSSSRPTTNGLNAGNYTLYYKAAESDDYTESNEGSINVTIQKASGSVTTDPTENNNLTYTGQPLTLLINKGSGTGEMEFKLEGGEWSTNIPTATNAGEYDVYFRAGANENYNASTDGNISVTIRTATPTVTKAPAAVANLKYSGSALTLITGGESSQGIFWYSTDNTNWSRDIPTATEVGTYNVWWKLVGNTNYSTTEVTKIENIQIAEADEEVTVNISATSGAITDTQEGTDNNNVKFVFVNNTGEDLQQFIIITDDGTGNYVQNIINESCSNGSSIEKSYNQAMTPFDPSVWGENQGNIYAYANTDHSAGNAYVGLCTESSYALGYCYTVTFTTVGYSSNNTVSSPTVNQGSIQVTSTTRVGIKVKNNTDESITINKVEFKTNNDGTVTNSGLLNIYSSAVTISSNETSSTYEIDISSNPCKGQTFASDTNNIILYDSNDNALISVETSGSLTTGTLYTITYGEASTDALFDTLLSDFNTVLYGSNSTKLTEESPDTVAYLDTMYKLADAEWKKNYSDSLFNDDLYPEAVEYRNTSDTSGDAATQKAMQGWLMAMCLAELCLSNGSNTNNQTKLYEKAMTYGNSAPYSDDSVDNNGNIVVGSSYGYKKDAMIARFVAGAIYASNHDNLIDEINTARSELGGTLINGNDFEDLAYSYSNSHIGYMPELIQILPVTPGPYTTSVDSYNIPSDKPTGNIFYGVNSNTNNDDQRDYNYKMDIAINNYVKQNYNLWTNTNSSSDCENLLKTTSGSTQSATTRQLVFEAGAIGICSKFNFFGKKKFKYNGVNTNGSTWMHEFDLADTTGETCGDNEYLYKGPFSDWYEVFDNPPAINEVDNSEYLNSDYSQNSELKYLQDMLDIFDERCFIYDAKMGRRRPLGGASAGDAIYTGYNHHPANGLQIATVMQYLADDRSTSYYSYNKIHNTFDDFPTDPPKSYPSGHSAQSWGMAMLLSQIKPSMLKTYMKNGWKFGTERVIGRAHWNSDVLFGRLSALTVLPIINAMNGTSFMSNYNALRKMVDANDQGIEKTGNSVSNVSNPVINVNVRITNNTGSDVTIQGRLRFILGNPNQDGSYFGGWSGGSYIRTDSIYFSNDSVTFTAGETKSYNNLTWQDADTGCGLGGASPLSSDYLPIYADNGSLAYARNILIYDGEGRSDTILCNNLSEDIVFQNNGTYDIVINSI